MKRAVLAIIVAALVGSNSGCCCLRELCCWKRHLFQCCGDCCGDTCCGDGYSGYGGAYGCGACGHGGCGGGGCGGGGCGAGYCGDWHEAPPHCCESCDHCGHWTGPQYARNAGPHPARYARDEEIIEEEVASAPRRSVRAAGKYRTSQRGI